MKITKIALNEFEQKSGVFGEHALGIAELCKKHNVFLFLRPTEFATTLNIKAGFATKSMDIHHKSSNWGPMAGAVTVDPAFNKKAGATNKDSSRKDAVPKPLTVKENEPHGAAKTMQLELSKDHLQMLIDNKYLKKIDGAEGSHYEGTPREEDNPSSEVKEQAAKYLFEIKGGQGKVRWVEKGKEKEDVAHHDLLVYAYETGSGIKPVTGDYDTWMFVPHMSWWKLHTEIVVVKDEHGKSAASLFNSWFIEELNKACGRADNPVFQHGAEAQNYGFTQNLDKELAMFTPGGSFRMINTSEEGPSILAQMMKQDYLVYWNKKYTEEAPKLSGAKEANPHLVKFYAAKPKPEDKQTYLGKENYEDALNAWENEYKHGITKEFAKKFLGEENKEKKLFPAECAIYMFNKHMQNAIAEPKLNPSQGDYGSFWEESPRALFDLQLKFQSLVVDATEDGGASGLLLIKNLDADPSIEERLSKKYGPAPGAPDWEGDFMLDFVSGEDYPTFNRLSAGKKPSKSANIQPPNKESKDTSATASATYLSSADGSSDDQDMPMLKLQISGDQIDLSFTGKLVRRLEK